MLILFDKPTIEQQLLKVYQNNLVTFRRVFRTELKRCWNQNGFYLPDLLNYLNDRHKTKNWLVTDWRGEMQKHYGLPIVQFIDELLKQSADAVKK